MAAKAAKSSGKSEAEKAAESGEAIILKKMSIKAMGINTRKEGNALNVGESSPCATIYGVATMAKPMSTNMGESVAFLGEFVGIPHMGENEGKKHVAAKLFLPKDLEEAISAKLAGDDVKSVEFGYKINMQYDETAAIGFVFASESLVKAKKSDALSALEKTLGL